VLVDPANRRGDPDPDVLSLLDTQTPLFRTDQGGVVHFWTDGERLYAEQAMD
jgi:beta-lactamase superfamily II metal-dependent hydrolase